MNRKIVKLAKDLGLSSSISSDELAIQIIEDIDSSRKDSFKDLSVLEEVMDKLILLYNIEEECRKSTLKDEEDKKSTERRENEKSFTDANGLVWSVPSEDRLKEIKSQREKEKALKENNLKIFKEIKDWMTDNCKEYFTSVKRKSLAYTDENGNQIYTDRYLFYLKSPINRVIALDCDFKGVSATVYSHYKSIEIFKEEFPDLFKYLSSRKDIEFCLEIK